MVDFVGRVSDALRSPWSTRHVGPPGPFPRLVARAQSPDQNAPFRRYAAANVLNTAAFGRGDSCRARSASCTARAPSRTEASGAVASSHARSLMMPILLGACRRASCKIAGTSSQRPRFLEHEDQALGQPADVWAPVLKPVAIARPLVRNGRASSAHCLEFSRLER